MIPNNVFTVNKFEILHENSSSTEKKRFNENVYKHLDNTLFVKYIKKYCSVPKLRKINLFSLL